MGRRHLVAGGSMKIFDTSSLEFQLHLKIPVSTFAMLQRGHAVGSFNLMSSVICSLATKLHLAFLEGRGKAVKYILPQEKGHVKGNESFASATNVVAGTSHGREPVVRCLEVRFSPERTLIHAPFCMAPATHCGHSFNLNT